MRRGTSPRVVIIGLDGADWSALRVLFADGAMPTLEALVTSGVSAPLESVYPTNSMSAWTSLMTAVNPGKHGVFGFVRNTGTPFQTSVTNSSDVRFPTIWETLARGRLRACVIDMPPLFPPLHVDGVTMLGGLGSALALSRGSGLAYPPEAEAAVQEAGGFVRDAGWADYGGRRTEFVAHLNVLIENRVRIAEALLEKYENDLFCVVFVAPDRLQHAFWPDLIEQGPDYALARKLYVTLDEALARLLDRLDPSATDILVVSDHGFRRFSRGFDVNQFLVEAGLMRWKPVNPRTAVMQRVMRLVPPLSAVAKKALAGRSDTPLARLLGPSPRRLLPGSVAYSDVVECVNLNLSGRESTGRVVQSEYEEVRDMVAAKLSGFRDWATGERPLKRVIKREECMHGRFLGEAPDLILEFGNGYAYSGGRSEVLWDSEGWVNGVHALTGVIACRGPHFRRGVEASTVSILDVAPTALSLLGVALPADVDGRIAEELLAGPVPPERRPAPGPQQPREEPKAYSEEEEARIKERLRGLGYLE